MCKEIRDKFLELISLDVNQYVEKKEGLSYLSWAYAWQEFKKIYPDATYDILRDEQGRPYFGDPDIGYMVYTTVTAGGLTYMMWLPVMDNANKAMKLKAYKYTTRKGEKNVEAVSMFDVNKAIMRCLVKNLAMFGLGLYIYAGEDLPHDVREYICSVCGQEVKGVKKNGVPVLPKDVYEGCGGMCFSCYKKNNNKESTKEETVNE